MLHIIVLSNINKPHSKKKNKKNKQQQQQQQNFACYKHINPWKLTQVTKVLSYVIELFANLSWE